MSFPPQGYIPTTVPVPVLRATLSNLARIVNEEWFASDFAPNVATENSDIIEITFCYSARAIIEVSLDSGSTWCKLNNNQKIEAETINTYQIPVINGDLINFRADTAGTIRLARVTEIGGE